MGSLKIGSPARSTDSFKPTLELILKHFQVKNCFEWGPGRSTELFLSHGCNTTSVEHDQYYFKMVKENYKVGNAHLIFEDDENFYPYVNGDYVPYDLVLVDGRMRVPCIKHAKLITKFNGFVILHDAERQEYQDAMNLFDYRFYTDNENTAVLIKDEHVAAKLERLLSSNPI